MVEMDLKRTNQPFGEPLQAVGFHAGVAELAYALDLGSSEATRRGSTPLFCTGLGEGVFFSPFFLMAEAKWSSVSQKQTPNDKNFVLSCLPFACT